MYQVNSFCPCQNKGESIYKNLAAPHTIRSYQNCSLHYFVFVFELHILVLCCFKVYCTWNDSLIILATIFWKWFSTWPMFYRLMNEVLTCNDLDLPDVMVPISYWLLVLIAFALNYTKKDDVSKKYREVKEISPVNIVPYSSSQT